MKNFQVTIRTAAGVLQFPSIAQSSFDAFASALEAMGDTVCGITVVPA